jgi:hypothetical protein
MLSQEDCASAYILYKALSEKSDENCVVKVNNHKYDWIRIQVGLTGLNEV